MPTPAAEPIPTPPPGRSTARMTVRQFERLGEFPPGLWFELIGGELVIHTSPKPPHGYTQSQLFGLLWVHIHERSAGVLFTDLNTIFSEQDLRRPDILFFRKERQHLIGQQRLEGLPDLAIEVVSPGSERVDYEEKFRQYAEGGIPWYWIADPQPQTLTGYELREGRYVQTGRARGEQPLTLPPFPDLSIPLGRLWWPAGSGGGAAPPASSDTGS